LPYFPDAVPVALLTGFLGSGKTTLLSTLLRDPAFAKTAVIINEFGEVGLDHSLIECSNDNIVELQNGCICCTIQNDLHETLRRLIGRRNGGAGFDRVVIESTGLADPVPIIHTLMTAPDLVPLYQLDTVITLVDAVNGAATLDAHPEAVKQAAMAQTLVVTKTDLIDKGTVRGLVTRLRELNPAATIELGQPQENDASSLLMAGGGHDPYKQSEDARTWLQAECYASEKHDHHHDYNVNRHGDDINAFVLTYDRPNRRFAFEMFLEMLAANLGPQLLRTKGILNIRNEGRPAVIHGVQQIFHPVRWLERWPDQDRSSRLVFITKGASRDEVDGFFQTLIGAVEDVVEDLKVDPDVSRRRPPVRATSATPKPPKRVW